MDDLKSVLMQKAKRIGEKIFIHFGNRTLTYRETNLLTNRLAHAFYTLGVRKGDLVAVMLPNCPEWIACWFALAKLGAVLVACNTQWKAEGLAYALKQADVKYFILAPEYQGESRKAETPGDVKKILFDLRGDSSPMGGTQALAGLVAAASSEEPSWEPPTGPDPLIITYTSGTTGWPKAVLNPHRAYIAAAEDLRDYVALTPEDIIYTFLPLYHANPQAYCVITALVTEASIALAEKFSASRFWPAIRFYKATAFSYVGAVLPILLNQPEREEEKGSPAKKCFGGGAPREIHEGASRRFGLQVCELYGMSETGTWNTINRPGEIKIGSVGKIRQDFELKVVDDQVNELPVGRVGEIVVRPRKPFIMFLGYYKMPEETLQCYGNLWFHTGDLGQVDGDGYFYFCGRKKESIRRGGENITPYEIEKVLTDHPAVVEAAAVGVPDPILGEEIKVYVVLKEGASVEPADLVARCGEKLPKFMVPRYVEFVSILPKTASEKIQKMALKSRGIGSSWDRLGRK
ncbi:MAG: AMP-binding protein [Deltaproteobacteria bacterium]|nr:AMP-binding protein [Deltaproteobacteria bacterium]